jgi:hypothetical protein
VRIGLGERCLLGLSSAAADQAEGVSCWVQEDQQIRAIWVLVTGDACAQAAHLLDGGVQILDDELEV